MAVNPALVANLPQPFPNEIFALRRSGMRAIIRGPFSFSLDGEIFVSTLRIIFVPKDQRNVMAFDIPLANIRNEKFNQPIFGCNNLSFTLEPIPGGGIEQVSEWKIEFRDGGCGSFLELFLRSLFAMRETLSNGRRVRDHQQHPFSQSVGNGTFSSTVFTDPSDPSTVYVASAVTTQNAQQATAPAYSGFYF
eukprot:c32709_g1_i1.p1 GENE.c32709_g1_i1~~c32709_g1_i1.p1  ORF type:complete len:192 (+),score=42.30 c32709_g1_i1:56-631(+)